MKRAQPLTGRAADNRWPWFLVGGVVVFAAGAVLLGADGAGDLGSHRAIPSEASESKPVQEPMLAAQTSVRTPVELLSDALAGSKAAWRFLHARVPDFTHGELTRMRDSLAVLLGNAVHPTALYRGGAEAAQLAARLADPPLCERLLALLSHWEPVVLKLPLTEQRDDLSVLEAVRQGVDTGGTREQRARLVRLLAIIRQGEPIVVHGVAGDARTETRER